MQRLSLSQTQSQRLSPQQIQFIKLLQLNVADIDARITQELEDNPVLQLGDEDSSTTGDYAGDEPSDGPDTTYDEPEPVANDEEKINLDDYLRDNDGFRSSSDGYDRGEEDTDASSRISAGASIADYLMTQLGYLPLSERQFTIGEQLIGSLEADGYLRRDLESISNDLAFQRALQVDEEEILQVLRMVQQFDPPGIAARNLQECLLLQLDRKQGDAFLLDVAIKIVEDYFEEFTKKHYDKIRDRMELEPQDLRDSIAIITKLNPKPGESGANDPGAQYVIPDFILEEQDGRLQLSLNSKNAPELNISPRYIEQFQAYERGTKRSKRQREEVSYLKQKLDSAKWFIDAIKQRQSTMLATMQAILELQYDFFLTGDESQLRPMILKDIAERIGMDISTVSRVANSKYVKTDFGTYLLKYFFSEGISTDSGEDVSNREVKMVLKEMIDGEDKREPLPDDQLERMLNDRGYNIARRTVAKYREQLGIPVARLRKEL